MSAILQESFLAYIPSLTCSQIKIYLLLNSLSGPDCRWVAISSRNICGPIRIDRETGLFALRGLLSCGLIQKHEQGTKRRSWYRTAPAVPLPADNWMTKLNEVPIRTAANLDGLPDLPIWTENPTSLPKSGRKTRPVSTAQSGGKNRPPVIHLDYISPAHPYITLTTNIERAAASIKSSDGIAAAAPPKEFPETTKKLEQYGRITEASTVNSMVSKCLKVAPQCTDEQIAAAVQEIGANLSPKVISPIAVIVSQVPKCFSGGDYATPEPRKRGPADRALEFSQMIRSIKGNR